MTAHAAPARAPRRPSNLTLLVSGQLLSLLGSEVTKLALPLFALGTLGATSGETGLLRAASLAPALVAAPLIGVWVDRTSRRRVLVVTGLAQAVVLVAVTAALPHAGSGLALLVVGVTVLGVLGQFGEVAYPSFVPDVAGGDLPRANGRIFGAQSLAETVGPGLAGVLLARAGLGLVLLLDAATFVIASVVILRIRVVEAVAPPARRALRHEVTVGVRAVLAHPLLRGTVLTSAAYNVLDTAATTVFLVHTTTALGMSSTQVGVVMGGAGVGAVLGSVLSARATAALGFGRGVVTAFVLGSLAPLPLLLARDAGPASVALCASVFAVWAFCVTAYSVQSLSVRQAATPQPLLGRVMAGSWMFVLGALPLGALLGGAAGDLWGSGPALTAVLCALPLTALPLLLSPVRRLTALPTPDADFWRRHG
ncbi:MFS transporter [Actinosynnema mirum]|uniref:Major facilitator superfamily MFS_1 n=1 Tax=Actinosynnema mirum (strain ATCC 29888 / DSM 43827 / JCM 3225 / NBRC 14064 / NCIMB 13271 / NRRL B-12336 / IMRU 3971 / 101) TaxID=446462 RepID=C6WQQ2_ACTMD|nr:MFS transporter [Actinosynnema mirum]ACU38742.1 major facilitator superfamily MFS_1 [Actinosynnema mirum DSM 43827]